MRRRYISQALEIDVKHAVAIGAQPQPGGNIRMSQVVEQRGLADPALTDDGGIRRHRPSILKIPYGVAA